MRIIAVVFAVLGGVVVLLGYFVPALREVQQLLLNWAIILAGAAALVGVFNLILVHATRIQKREKGGGYSLLLLLSLFSAFVFALLLGPDHPEIRRLVGAVIVPAESSLMGLLAVSLITGAARILRRGLSLMSAVFLGSAVLMLLASATVPFGEIAPLTAGIRPWFQHVFAMGAARGILIGMGLGTLVTGLRVLIGAHRPYEAG